MAVVARFGGCECEMCTVEESHGRGVVRRRRMCGIECDPGLRGAMARFVLVVVALAAVLESVNAEVLTPPYFNLAEKKRIKASATCGEDTQGTELYCKLVGANTDREVNVNLIQGQVCDYCDANDPEKKHPAEYAVDGLETWWQSPPLSRSVTKDYNKVDLTIDLGQEFHVAYILIKMANSPRPAVWALERSVDDGKTYQPWQYFADSEQSCIDHFGPETIQPITRDDSIICETEYSKIVPLEGGEIVISFLNKRPSANDFFNSSVLQEFTRATNVRLRFMRTKTLLGHLMSVARQDPTVTRRYFYSIKDISIGGRCVCNGHAQNCDIVNPADNYKLICDCKHNTDGHNCEKCKPGFQQKKWKQSKHNELFQCEPCNCFGHSNDCVYNEEVDRNRSSIDIHGNYDGGGVCLNCQHNTEGINCNKCKSKFYRPWSVPLNATDVCRPCNCYGFNLTGNCDEGTGRCQCGERYKEPRCDSCNVGFHSFPECKPCDCFINGTRGQICTPEGGICPCKQNFRGPLCYECKAGFFGFPNCTACDCHSTGSLSEVCDIKSGQCQCKNNFGGRACDQCQDNYFNYPRCEYCNCDVRGTIPGVCDKESGKCLCREGYAGERCDECRPGYFGYPDCKPCNCSKIGSFSDTCDSNGACKCLKNFAGKACDQCRSGYYSYPDCRPCNCDHHGSIGEGCNAIGHCECRPNFQGAQCDSCRDGLYNFPVCEECNCVPAGVLDTFQGCAAMPVGELCRCKERVQGRICDVCKPTFWNLQPYHTLGCEECFCHRPGVLGEIGECNTKSGQCLCKPSVTDRRCSVCKDGFYNLQSDNLFGCSACDCNVGGSVNNACNKLTGQCLCQPRVEGRTCNQPLSQHYFPTLHHLKYEAEDGFTPEHRPAHYDYKQSEFKNFSWKGYAYFVDLQPETVYTVDIQRPSLYRIVLYYVNSDKDPHLGTITITPDDPDREVQVDEIRLKPTEGEPMFSTVAGASGNIPHTFVLDPGRYTVNIKFERGNRLLLDYFVFLPAAYYEAPLLVRKVSTPCMVGNQTICRHYRYPKLEQSTVNYETNFFTGDDRSPPFIYLDNREHLEAIGVGRLPVLSSSQPELRKDITVREPGPHVLVVNYITPETELSNAHLTVDMTGSEGQQSGRAILHPCPYTTVCRQAVIDDNGKVVVFQFDNDDDTVILKADPDVQIAIESVIPIPFEDWSLKYVEPHSACVRKDGKCIQGQFPRLADQKKVDFETGNEAKVSLSLPPGVNANDTSGLIYLNFNDPTVTVHGKVAYPDQYVMVIHYYQPDHPDFQLNAVVDNGQKANAFVPIAHCPEISGCRAVVRQPDGNTRFMIPDEFNLTLSTLNRYGVWLEYVLLIPADKGSVIELEPLDETTLFIKECGSNHFFVPENSTGFCRDAVFALTTAYNYGAQKCACDTRGSVHLDCNKFGGQCPCKENIIGRQCTKCASGYYDFPNCKPCKCPPTAKCDEIDGSCRCPENTKGPNCDECAENTYGWEPKFGCTDCACSEQGVKDMNLQCDVFNGTCLCKPNVEGRKCDKCSPGHYDFPNCEKCDCDLRGTKRDICDQNTAVCNCKEYVHGQGCDVCADGTFDIQADNEQGCTKCFCFGKSKRCSSARLYRAHIKQLEGWTLASISTDPSFMITPLNSSVTLTPNSISASFLDQGLKDHIVFFKAPDSYYGNLLTAYGGNLNYTLMYTPELFGEPVDAAEVILQGSTMTLFYFSYEQPSANEDFEISLPILEKNFRLLNGQAVTREILMQTLHDLKSIYIRASYWNQTMSTILRRISLDTASEQYNPVHGIAHAVEQCHCPLGYKGLSCEECAEGYYRSDFGLHGGHCRACQCNGHSNKCDPDTGKCFDCQHNTKGDHCELCDVGYYGNATNGMPDDCLICACPLPIPSNNFATSCLVSPDGSRISCNCEKGYTGARCESCAAGYYGIPEKPDDYCKPCTCNNNINPDDPGSCDSVTGECMRCLNNTSGPACQYCQPGYYGDAIERKDCKSCDCHKCGTYQCNHTSGVCECHKNVVGESCDQCAPDHWGFNSCQGCEACNCGEASLSTQCDLVTGQCQCKEGVTGTTCQRCKPGYWNYTSEGCVSCGCNLGFSRGFGCNPVTGQCECLPGVIGERCDHCPHRWVLKPNEGCFSCDNCTHRLLDVTDELAFIIDPVAKNFKEVELKVHTAQRLLYINKTTQSLLPKASQIAPVDLSSVKSQVDELDRQAVGLESKGDYRANSTEADKVKTDSLVQKARDLERRVEDNIIEVGHLINRIKYDPDKFDPVGEAQAEHLILAGRDLLAQINELSYEDILEETNRSLSNIQSAWDRISTLVWPIYDQSGSVDDVIGKVNVFEKRLDTLQDYSRDSQKQADDINLRQIKDRIKKLKETVKAIENRNAKVAELQQSTKESLQNGTSLVTNGVGDFEDIGEKIEELEQRKNELNKTLNEFSSQEELLNDTVGAAKIHSEELKHQASQYESAFSEGRNVSEKALSAANAYYEILNLTTDALKIAEEAQKAAKNATDLLDGLEDSLKNTDDTSRDLLEEATGALYKTQNVLKPQLTSAVYQVENVEEKLMGAKKILDDVNTAQKSLKTFPSESELQDTVYIADSASEQARNAAKQIGDILSILPGKSTITKQLPNNVIDTKSYINQAEKQLDSIDIPTLGNVADKVTERQANFKSGSDALKDKTENLARKIDEARDIVSRFRVGVTFFPNTTLQLRNPKNLMQQATFSNISLNFKTKASDALLFFLGNDKASNAARRKRQTSRKRPTTDDFMALEIVNGYLLLTVDLGSSPQRISLDDTPVNDDRWYRVDIVRAGKTVWLTLHDESKPNPYVKKDVIKGSSSILNLDPEHSKLFVGGFPATFNVQGNLRNSFSGQIDGLTIGNEPVSLWNFVDGSDNNVAAKRKDTKGNVDPASGYRFDGNGFVKVDAQEYIQKTNRNFIQFSFKTTARDGLLFLAGTDRTFISLELKKGKLFYRFRLGEEGIGLIESDNVYDDDAWHRVEASRDNGSGILVVDDGVRKSDNIVGSDIEKPKYMYFGGLPHGETSFHNHVYTAGFDGCIKDVNIDETTVNLLTNVQAYGVKPGCPDKSSDEISFHEGSSGFLQGPSFTTDQTLEMSLSFKTTSANPGLIALATNQDKSVSLSLQIVDGKLVLQSQSGEVSSGSKKYNDGLWHIVVATYESQKLQLDVDDAEHYEVMSFGPPPVIYNGETYFGGTPPDLENRNRVSNIHSTFVGCIRHVTIGEAQINFANPVAMAGAVIGKCLERGGADAVPIVPYPVTDSDQSSTPDRTYPEPISSSSELPVYVGNCKLPLRPQNQDTLPGKGYRFGTIAYSRIEYAHIPKTVKKNSDFSVDFKTEAPDGLIFYTQSLANIDHIALFLKDGKVHYTFNCGTGAAVLSSDSSYNDGEWHTAAFNRTEANGTLRIDGELVATGNAPGATNTIEVSPPLYLGGVPANYTIKAKEILSKKIPNFEGCLHNFKVHNKQSGNRTKTFGVVNCSNNVEKGVFFSGTNSYIRAIENFRVGATVIVNLDIRPRSISGVLLSVHHGSDYMVLQMVNGSIKFTVDNGKGPLVIQYDPPSPHSVCDGKWHHIKAEKVKNVLVLTVNNVKRGPLFGPSQAQKADTKSTVYVGGYARTHNSAQKPRGIETEEQFVGCIRDLQITKKVRQLEEKVPISLSAAHASGDVITGVCPLD